MPKQNMSKEEVLAELKLAGYEFNYSSDGYAAIVTKLLEDLRASRAANIRLRGEIETLKKAQNVDVGAIEAESDRYKAKLVDYMLKEALADV